MSTGKIRNIWKGWVLSYIFPFQVVKRKNVFERNLTCCRCISLKPWRFLPYFFLFELILRKFRIFCEVRHLATFNNISIRHWLKIISDSNLHRDLKFIKVVSCFDGWMDVGSWPILSINKVNLQHRTFYSHRACPFPKTSKNSVPWISAPKNYYTMLILYFIGKEFDGNEEKQLNLFFSV